MKQSPLQRRTPLRRSTPLTSTPARSRPRAISPASSSQRRKVQFAPCVVCCADGCEPAHLTPRGFRGCDHEDCVIALCRVHHRAFDDGALDLLPHLSGRGFSRELAHMQGHYDDPISVLQRLSGHRWVPEGMAA